MALYTIADLHLPLGIDKPMDIFGAAWSGYVERLADNWQSKIKTGDTVVMPGDFSWATYLEQSYRDFEFLHKLNGRKILLKGNHDYWWTTLNKLRTFIADNGFSDIDFLHNNSYKYENTAICGTRGWLNPSWESFSDEDEKIFSREAQRLELSIKTAGECDEITVFTHYPPLSVQREPNAFTDVMKKYGVKKCFYGHLHGPAHKSAVEGIVDGTEYKLVSADYLRFEPMLIRE